MRSLWEEVFVRQTDSAASWGEEVSENAVSLVKYLGFPGLHTLKGWRMRIPPGAIELHEAAEKYRSTWRALRQAIYRKRLKGFKIGAAWFSTGSEVKRYLESRNVDKIPKSYRKRA